MAVIQIVNRWNWLFIKLNPFQVGCLIVLSGCASLHSLLVYVVSMHLFTVLNVTFLVIAQYILVSLQQWQKILERLLEQPCSRCLNEFMINHTRLFTLLTHFDRIYGSIFVKLFLVQLISNLVAVFRLYTSKDSSFNHNLTNISMILFQFINVFVLHFVCALFTKRLHQCSKLLIQIHNRKLRISLSNRLRLMGYIEKYHTHKRYGFTYVGGRLVTMYSFFKVSGKTSSITKLIIFWMQFLFLYVRFSIITFRLFHH